MYKLGHNLTNYLVWAAINACPVAYVIHLLYKNIDIGIAYNYNQDVLKA